MQSHNNRCQKKKPGQNLSLDLPYYAAILIPQSHSPLKLLYVSTKSPFVDFLVFYSLNKIRSTAPKQHLETFVSQHCQACMAYSRDSFHCVYGHPKSIRSENEAVSQCFFYVEFVCFCSLAVCMLRKVEGIQHL